MNIPNRLTVLRILMTPLFLAALVIEFPFHYFAALFLFVVASVTDYYDGMLARKHNLITNFGKFLDPIADKMLTTSAFIGFAVMKDSPWVGLEWILFVVLAREFLVASVRMIAASKGTVIAADLWGKVKTVVQMVAIVMAITFEGAQDVFARYCPDFTMLNLPMDILANVALWLSAVLTVISGINYMIKNKDCLGLKDM